MGLHIKFCILLSNITTVIVTHLSTFQSVLAYMWSYIHVYFWLCWGVFPRSTGSLCGHEPVESKVDIYREIKMSPSVWSLLKNQLHVKCRKVDRSWTFEPQTQKTLFTDLYMIKLELKKLEQLFFSSASSWKTAHTHFLPQSVVVTAGVKIWAAIGSSKDEEVV